jgi:hypothetical protein
MSWQGSHGSTFEKANYRALGPGKAYELDAHSDDAIRLRLCISHLTCDRHFDGGTEHKAHRDATTQVQSKLTVFPHSEKFTWVGVANVDPHTEHRDVGDRALSPQVRGLLLDMAATHPKGRLAFCPSTLLGPAILPGPAILHRLAILRRLAILHRLAILVGPGILPRLAILHCLAIQLGPGILHRLAILRGLAIIHGLTDVVEKFGLAILGLAILRDLAILQGSADLHGLSSDRARRRIGVGHASINQCRSEFRSP